jgi:hypothetical protein
MQSQPDDAAPKMRVSTGCRCGFLSNLESLDLFTGLCCYFMKRQIVNVGAGFEADLNVDRLSGFILQHSKYGVRVGIAVHVYAY